MLPESISDDDFVGRAREVVELFSRKYEVQILLSTFLLILIPNRDFLFRNEISSKWDRICASVILP